MKAMKKETSSETGMTDKVIILGYVGGNRKHMSERVIDPNGICFTLMAMTHGWGQGYLLEYEDNTETTEHNR